MATDSMAHRVHCSCKELQDLKTELSMSDKDLGEILDDPYMRWGMIQHPETLWTITAGEPMVDKTNAENDEDDTSCIFTDGSLHKPSPGLRCATWAKVKVDLDGNLKHAVFGAVRQHLPQTSGAG